MPEGWTRIGSLTCYCRFQQHCRGRFRRRKCFLQQLCSAVAAPERPRRASSAPQRPPGACAVSRPTLPALWCGQPLPPAANSAPCPGSACAFAARAAGHFFLGIPRHLWRAEGVEEDDIAVTTDAPWLPVIVLVPELQRQRSLRLRHGTHRGARKGEAWRGRGRRFGDPPG